MHMLTDLPIKSFMAGLVLPFLVAVQAQATVVTTVTTISGSGTDTGPITVTTPRSDPALGTLTGVSVTFDGTLQASVWGAPHLRQGALSFSNAVRLVPNAADIALPDAVATPGSGSSMTERMPVHFTSAMPVSYVTRARSGELDLTFLFTPLLRDPELGAGSETIDFAGTIAQSFSYDVPEPASAALLGALLLATGLYLRPRR